MKSYHGIDLHASKLVMHSILLTDEGVKRKSKTVYTDDLETTFFPHYGEEDIFCVEASTCTAWFAQELRKTGAQVIVINPFDFKALYVTSKKTDKIDAKKLAEHVYSRDVLTSECMEEVHVPQRDIQMLRKSISLYQFVSKNIVACQNQLLGLFRAKCIMVSYRVYLSQRDNLLSHKRLDDFDRQCIIELESMIKHYTEQKKLLRERIIQLGLLTRKDEIALLITMPGMSVFGAACVLADIDNVERFKTSKKLCAYLSSAPGIDSSNQSTHIKTINKHGRKIAFNQILQSLNHILDSNINFLAFKSRRGPGKAQCKIRVAIVRKTIVTIYYMLKNKEQYRFINSTIYEKKMKELTNYSQVA